VGEKNGTLTQEKLEQIRNSEIYTCHLGDADRTHP